MQLAWRMPEARHPSRTLPRPPAPDRAHRWHTSRPGRGAYRPGRPGLRGLWILRPRPVRPPDPAQHGRAYRGTTGATRAGPMALHPVSREQGPPLEQPGVALQWPTMTTDPLANAHPLTTPRVRTQAQARALFAATVRLIAQRGSELTAQRRRPVEKWLLTTYPPLGLRRTHPRRLNLAISSQVDAEPAHARARSAHALASPASPGLRLNPRPALLPGSPAVLRGHS